MFPADTVSLPGYNTMPQLQSSESNLSSVASGAIPAGGANDRIFEGHQLKPVNNAPVHVPERVPDWFTIVLFGVVVFFVWIRLYYFKIIRQLVAAFFSNNLSNQLVRDENILVQRASILLSFVFYFTGALFLYQVSIHYKWDYPILGEGIVRLIVMLLIVAFAYSLKLVLVKGLGELFDIERPVATYLFNIALLNNILGLALFPIVVAVAYVATHSVGTFLLAGIGLVIIIFIYRLVRAFSIWTTMKGVPIFYLILYFCTLEIAPVMILIKLAGG